MEAPRPSLRAPAVLIAGALLLSGCPRKLTEEVVREVPKECPPAAPAAAPAPSVHELVTVAIVRTQDGPRAVLASPSWATVVGLGDEVGSEKASVNRILPDGVSVQLPDTTNIKVPLTAELPSAAELTGDGAEVPGGDAADTAELADLQRWRSSVMTGVSRGYGIPVDMLWAMNLALMPHEPPAVANALKELGWSPVSGIGQAKLTRVEIRDGTLSADGWAPSKVVLDSLVGRLQSANPIVSTATLQSSSPADGGLKFTMNLSGPSVGARDIATDGQPSAEGPWPAELQAELQQAADKLPKNPALGGVEDDLRAVANRFGLSVAKIQRLPKAIEEGYLGMVSFDIEATGSVDALTAFLASLRAEGASGRPVVVDPLVVRGQQLQATIRIPYVAGKVDTRSPAPPSLLLPALTNARWRPARSLPLPTLRNPFE